MLIHRKYSIYMTYYALYILQAGLPGVAQAFIAMPPSVPKD